MTKKSSLALEEVKYVERFAHKCGKNGKRGEMFTEMHSSFTSAKCTFTEFESWVNCHWLMGLTESKEA